MCYLFKNKDDHVEDAFVKNRFKGWEMPVAFDKHVNKFSSIHNQDRLKYDALNKPKASIQNIFDKHKKQDKNKYRAHLLVASRMMKLKNQVIEVTFLNF